MRLDMDIKTAIAKCIDDLSLSKNTERTYINGLKSFVNFVHEKGLNGSDNIEKLGMGYFVDFFAWLNRNYSKQTAGVYSSASKALLDWLVIGRYISVDYIDEVRYKKAMLKSHRRRETKLPRFPKKDDVSRMLDAVRVYEDQSPRKERNIALLELLASSGCRISEVTNLNVADIDLTNRTVIVTGKGSKERRVFFSETASHAIDRYWTNRKSNMPTDPAFGRHDRGAGHKRIKRMSPTTARNIVKDVAVIAGVDPTKFSPHYFRHAFAIRVLSETGNLALAQDLLGHLDPKSTRVYAKIHQEDLQNEHRKIFA